MKITKQSAIGSIDKSPKTYLLGVDNDLVSIFNLSKGRVRFGDIIDGANGENIKGQFQIFTTHGTPNTEFEVKHTLGANPTGWIVMNKDKAGDLYASTTTWTSSSVYLKCSVASVTYKVFLLV